MKKILLILLIVLIGANYSYSQVSPESTSFEPALQQPYGKLNPQAPPQVADFDPMVGVCDCRSLSRNPDGSWQDTTNMVWQFKYVLNGTAVQDEVWRDGNYASSIRQYHADSAQWIVTYYSFPFVAYKPGVWYGNKQDDGSIVLKQPQVAPNGMNGVSTLTFYEISSEGFNWKGEWIKDDGTVTYPFWRIWCRKRE